MISYSIDLGFGQLYKTKNKRVTLTQLGLSQLQVQYPTMCIQALSWVKVTVLFCSVYRLKLEPKRHFWTKMFILKIAKTKKQTAL